MNHSAWLSWICLLNTNYIDFSLLKELHVYLMECINIINPEYWNHCVVIKILNMYEARLFLYVIVFIIV
jgi:hypothetical protein